jgi:hypothetical protein
VFQAAQAGELLQIVVNTTPLDRSLVVVGDMNSSPDHPAIPGPLPLPFNLERDAKYTPPRNAIVLTSQVRN